MTEKYVVVFDTLCEGHQCWEDENGNPDLFDTIEEAENEIQEHFELSNEGRDEPYEEPNEFVLPLSEFIKGRKAIFIDGGVKIIGEEQDEQDCYDLTPKEMIATEVGLPMFDLEEAKHTYVHCSDDLTIECLVHSDGEIVDGMNLLVKVNQPSQNITDSYRLMISADYFDFTKEEQDNDS